MRKFLIGLMALAVIGVACSNDDTAGASGPTGATSPRPARPAPRRRPVRAREPEPPHGRNAHGRHRQPRVPAVVRRHGTYGPWKASPTAAPATRRAARASRARSRTRSPSKLGLDRRTRSRGCRCTFNESFKPGDKDFDFDINQISYSPDRAQAVDFSESYYDVYQALVALKGTPITDATTFADLKGYKLGAQIGTTSYSYIVEQHPARRSSRPCSTGSVDAMQALNNGQIDGFLTDAPTAYVNVLIGQVKNGVVVGQFPAIGDQEYFGLVFAKGNPLVDCVNQAIEALKSDGTLDALEASGSKDVTFPEITQ